MTAAGGRSVQHEQRWATPGRRRGGRQLPVVQEATVSPIWQGGQPHDEKRLYRRVRSKDRPNQPDLLSGENLACSCDSDAAQGTATRLHVRLTEATIDGKGPHCGTGQHVLPGQGALHLSALACFTLTHLHTAVLPKIPHSNCGKRVPNRSLRGRRGRFGTLLQLLECGIFGRTAVRLNSGLWIWKAQLTQGLLYQFSENSCALTVSKEFQVSSATMQRPIWNTSATL